ncbi:MULTISPECIES: hypothetical protein [unclassified Paenibacillus]|uniref:hypothetical protein n=1 Tax=unclassified Paenibacillus TaxID=185978 RepID=UPI0003FADFDC|nr:MULTISPECIES: hypothetical protein [unclassified Paenibacillus]KGP85291.1 hypothetical protein P364_0101350 [Paenibacillus sp. MAEPY2]KGP88136.1 hypothetical protein P363_0108215 [Paenibacillus sp. MAEPY1]
MGLFNSREPYAPQDVLCIFKEDGTAAIAPVVEINDERVFAESLDGNYAIPLGDLKSFTGPKGRVFLYPTSVENVTDCQRIAALERSTVLRQITHFAPEEYESGAKAPIGKIMLVVGGIVALFLIIKGLGG